MSWKKPPEIKSPGAKPTFMRVDCTANRMGNGRRRGKVCSTLPLYQRAHDVRVP